MFDFLFDTDGFVIEDNDFVIGVSDLQQQEDILLAQKGALKDMPGAGVGIENALNDSEIEALLTDVRIEFEKDGMTVNSLSYNEQTGDLDYDANY